MATTVVEVDGIVTRREEPMALATMESAPQIVLAEAHAAAKALQSVIAGKAKPVIMNGEQYLEFEDWQTLGRFFGITPKLESLEFVEFPGGTSGFHATAVALRAGEVITRADAYCLNDEEKWRARSVYKWLYVTRDGEKVEDDPGPDSIVWEPNPNKPGKKRPQKVRELVGEETVPLYQLASMAQTRANAKALRNVLAWVAVLAGYRPTPAEELTDVAARHEAPAQPAPEHDPEWPNNTKAYEQHGVEPPPSRHTNGQRPVSPPSGSVAACPQCGKPASPSKYPKANKTHYCVSCKLSFEPGVKA